jgi:uncharacterized protein (DUF488 family)
VPTCALFTIGHSTRPFDEFVAMLRAWEIEALVDVRTAAGSRRHPQFNAAALESELPRAGIAYERMPALGGFRRPRADSPNSGWRNASFRGYADYMETSEFRAALDTLIDRARDARLVIMCAEAVPWRCHRSLIADALVARGCLVRHITSGTRAGEHHLTPFAHVDGASVTYPALV